MQDIIDGFFHKKHFWFRLCAVVAAVIVMGFCLSWLLLVDLGTDPCTLMNVAIADTIGMSLGNWQALLNTVLLVIVVIFGGRNLGFGTLANMFLVGYSIDFFRGSGKNSSGGSVFRLGCARCRTNTGAGGFCAGGCGLYGYGYGNGTV